MKYLNIYTSIIPDVIGAPSAAAKPVYDGAEPNPRDTRLRRKHPTSQIVSMKAPLTPSSALDGRPPRARRSEHGTHALCNVCKYTRYREQSDAQTETTRLFSCPPPGSFQSSRSGDVHLLEDRNRVVAALRCRPPLADRPQTS